LQCLILLVQRDCDITLGDNNGYLALHHCAKNNKVDCCRFLVKQGTSLEATQADGKTPAHVVGFRKCSNGVKWIIPNTNDIARKNRMGTGPLTMS
jgi:ankyrin repeat protein